MTLITAGAISAGMNFLSALPVGTTVGVKGRGKRLGRQSGGHEEENTSALAAPSSARRQTGFPKREASGDMDDSFGMSLLYKGILRPVWA